MHSEHTPTSTTDLHLLTGKTGTIKMASFIAKSVNNRFRQKMIGLLLANKKMAVKDLCSQLHAEQSIVSQHLALLRKASLVSSERHGKCVLYSLNEQKLLQLIHYFTGICSIAK
ncbi:MAG TPA: metalloregulator ArsR/SmtB family transcription factor [Chitinophagales bacterium]|nr:metalloregulator ArsR/SmtB family transcription factor [Chitinophagales bacterium]